MRIRIEGYDLPGRREAPGWHELPLGNVHVGVQRTDARRMSQVVGLMRADEVEVVWELEVTTRRVDGLLDVGGPWVHGRPGARFLYLSWGAVTGGEFAMFRRAKLMFGNIPGEPLLAAAAGHGVLTGRLALTGSDGGPICARVRPPAVEWVLR